MNTTLWDVTFDDEFNESTVEINREEEYREYGRLLITESLTSFLVLLAVTLTVESKYLDESIRQPFNAVLALLLKFFGVPLLVFFSLLIFKLKEEEALGTLVVFCTTTGSIANLVIFYTDGDVPLGICTTACSTLLSFGFTPFLLLIYSKNWDKSLTFTIPYDQVALELSLAIIAIFLGFLVRYFLQSKSKELSQLTFMVTLALASMSAIASPIINTIFVDSQNGIYGFDYQTWAIALLLPPISFVLSHIVASNFCRMTMTSGRTMAFLATGESTALGTAILVETKLTSSLAIPRLFGFCMMLESVLFVLTYRIYKTKYSKNTMKIGKERRENGDVEIEYLKLSDEKTSKEHYYLSNEREAESAI